MKLRIKRAPSFVMVRSLARATENAKFEIIEELIGREDISSGIHLSAVEIKRRNPVKGRMHFFSSFSDTAFT